MQDELEDIERQNKKSKEPKPTETSKVIQNGILWEQIYDPETKQSRYITWDPKHNQPIYMEYFLINGIKHIPIHDDLIEKGLVVLPTGIIDYENINLLRNDIHQFVHKYVDVSPEHEEKACLYVELSWVSDNIHTIPYLRALADYGCGKTRYEDTIGGICYKPMYVGGSVRSAPIYRVIDLWRGTAIFDEFTLKQSDEAQDIIQILNNGFQRGKGVLRCKDGDYSKVEAFDPFGAKILSTRKPFEDKALESRCITEIMTETSRKDIPIDLGKEFYRERGELQNKLLMYRLKNWDTIEPDENLKVDFGNIQPRIKQTFLPFIVLFQNDSEQLNYFVDTVKKYNEALIEENTNSKEGYLIKIYLDYSNEGIPEPTPLMIMEKLTSDYGFSTEKTYVRTVGKWLKTLGFKSVVTKDKATNKTIRVLKIEDTVLKRLIYRYIPMEDQEKYILAVDNKIKAPEQQKIEYQPENELVT